MRRNVDRERPGAHPRPLADHVRGFFYPAGREKLHALGALDLALWDIKGKVLNAPVYELLGGLTRNYVECYSTGFPWQGSWSATAQTDRLRTGNKNGQ